jgi:hypothetical protein
MIQKEEAMTSVLKYNQRLPWRNMTSSKRYKLNKLSVKTAGSAADISVRDLPNRRQKCTDISVKE